MDTAHEPRRSNLFVLRVWCVGLDDGTKEWRGVIESLASREKRYFREWPILLDWIQQELRATSQDDFRLSQKKSDSE